MNAGVLKVACSVLVSVRRWPDRLSGRLRSRLAGFDRRIAGFRNRGRC